MRRHLARVLSPLAVCLGSAAVAQAMVFGGSYPLQARGIGDVTGDGRADYVAVTGLTWIVHDGVTGAAVPSLNRPWSSGDRYVGVGDFDGDGRDDVCHVNTTARLSTILSGANGASLLALPNAIVDGGIDADADGRADLLLTSYDLLTGDATTWIRSSRTSASLFSQVATSGSFDSYRWAVLGDENGDGYGDAGLLHATSLYPGELSLDAVIRGPVGSSVPIGLWGGEPCGDVNGDGATDIAVSVGMFVSTPSIVAGGSHTTMWTLASEAYVHGIGDVNGDGRADIAGTYFTTTLYSGATHLALPGASPTVTPSVLGDLDGDGRVEVADGTMGYQWVDPALPVASRMLRRGTPGTTSSGRKPTIVTRGHCGLGRTVWLDIRGNEPNSLCAFAIGDAASADLTPLGAPGNHAYTTMLGVSALLADGHGLARLTFVMPTSPTLLGATASVQAACFDPAANALGLVSSNAIDFETRN